MRVEDKPEVTKPITTDDAPIVYSYQLNLANKEYDQQTTAEDIYLVKIKSELEDITKKDYVFRVKVIGGWIVMKYHHGMVFIEDPNHLWEVDKG
jgi:hypothetical protein